MGHSVNIKTYDYKNGNQKQKDLIYAELNQEAIYCSDCHCELPSRIEWLERTFEDFETARKYLENHGGFYWQGAVKYKRYEKSANSKSERLQKKVNDLLQKQVKLKTDLNDYVAKNNMKNRKSNYVGCLNCGSKLNKNFIPIQMYSQNCPLCHIDLFSNSVKERIKNYRKQIDDLDKQIELMQKEESKAKNTEKFNLRWAVKYEYHV